MTDIVSYWTPPWGGPSTRIWETQNTNRSLIAIYNDATAGTGKQMKNDWQGRQDVGQIIFAKQSIIIMSLLGDSGSWKYSMRAVRIAKDWIIENSRGIINWLSNNFFYMCGTCIISCYEVNVSALWCHVGWGYNNCYVLFADIIGPLWNLSSVFLFSVSRWMMHSLSKALNLTPRPPNYKNIGKAF